MFKKHFQNLPFVTNRKEIIDFKTFCEGGSPEYVRAKQRLKNFHLSTANRGDTSALNFEPSEVYRIFPRKPSKLF